MQEISIKEIQGFAIGQTENREGGTGVTVVLSKKGVLGGLDVRGGGPASRESTLVDPLTAPPSTAWCWPAAAPTVWMQQAV